jgi:hypothetical protein
LLGHSDTGIDKSEGVGGLVWDDLDLEVRLIFSDLRISE